MIFGIRIHKRLFEKKQGEVGMNGEVNGFDYLIEIIQTS